jgi:hypothetical protein
MAIGGNKFSVISVHANFFNLWINFRFTANSITSKLINQWFIFIQYTTILYEEFEDTKGIIRICISKKNRQHNGQKKKYKRTQQSTKHTHKTKDRVTRTPLKTRGELECSGRVGSFYSTSGTRRVNLVTNPVISEIICIKGHF